MSAPNNEGNSWLSLADLLQTNTSVATLATAIEASGIQTYDRFGRRIQATDDNAESRVSKARALDLLAAYYKFQNELDNNPNIDPDSWYDYDSPLYHFGWPEDEAPKFETYSCEGVPETVSRPQHRMDDPPVTRKRRTYLTLIAAMCKHKGLDPESRGAAQRIMKMTDELGAHIDDGTIQTILAEIPDALETRLK